MAACEEEDEDHRQRRRPGISLSRLSSSLSSSSPRSSQSAAAPQSPQLAGIPGLRRQLVFEQNWQDFLALCMDSHVDRRRVLVTDRMGVDVQIFELGDESLCSDRFPVMLHLHAPLLPESAGTVLEADDGVDIARPSNAGLTQCTAEVSFRDVWPGIVGTKLWDHGIFSDGGGCSAVTDRTGVIIDILADNKRFPCDHTFPLKVLFQAVEPLSPRRVGNGFKHEGSVELQLEDVMPLVVVSKLWQMGFYTDKESLSKGRVLLTDWSGVDVSLCKGIPHHSRFPLKMHFERSAFELRGPDDSDDESLDQNMMRPKNHRSKNPLRVLKRTVARGWKRHDSADSQDFRQRRRHSHEPEEDIDLRRQFRKTMGSFGRSASDLVSGAVGTGFFGRHYGRQHQSERHVRWKD